MASSSSSSPSAPAFSSQSWNYDVFLSFRGEDTRKNFVDHLYSALLQQGIHTYKDEETLRRGELIGSSLMKAIEESRIAVIVFSENYADSSWCLVELTHIMKCKHTSGQIVMPVFYNVDPSQVRKQNEKYGKAFVRHELENKNKVESWRKALVEASNLSGWETKNIANGHESEVIKRIVEDIASRLKQVISSANENLVGIKARVISLKTKLQIGSGGVRMIGIWGVGGGGKTTLASSVYGEISCSFDGCCFVENVREEASRHGLGTLKERILSKMEAHNVGGRSLINERFRNRKFLLVLDDVDHLDQLEALAASPDWFGEGSRIIITTRDEHLLKAHKVEVHTISLLNGNEAIELFRKHAHRDSTSDMEDYEQLTKEVVYYAGGLPLALKVLGCCLCDKNIHEWRSALARLKKTPDSNILEKLKISFDGLTKAQKDLFLDIACFFRLGRSSRFFTKVVAMDIFDACGYDPVIGVKELRHKALITILGDGRFDMHDLVQEMGHYIVRGEHPNNPDKHTRVWKREDVLRICAMDATEELDMIEAIRFKRDWKERFSNELSSQVYPPIVANMKNLRWIHWEGDVTSPLPTNFPPRELCCLILDGISQKQLWEGYKYLPNLKIMVLWGLNKLKLTPRFDGLPNLERFTLSGCRDLKEIHSSIEKLDKIVSLRIEDCSRINKFPSVTRLKKLQNLSFYKCPRIFEVSEPLIQKLYYCLPHNNMNHIQLCFSHIDLRKLDLSGCNLGDEYMSSAVWKLPNLQELDLSANKFSRLDFGLLRLPRLKWLCVSDCSRLVELSELPSSIAVLEAGFCWSLESLGDISNCKWLWKVSLEGRNRVDGDILLDSILKGNAIEDHRISVSLPHWKNSEGVVLVDRLFLGNTFRLHLPNDWYSGFCGFLIHLVTYNEFPIIDIMMEEEEGVDEDPPLELWQESNQELEPDEYRFKPMTCVGYVSFSSLGDTACFNSKYNLISFSLRPSGGEDRIGAALVPRKTKKHHPLQTTTDSSQFWDGEDDYWKTFSIHHDSNSFIKIEWRPYTNHNI